LFLLAFGSMPLKLFTFSSPAGVTPMKLFFLKALGFNPEKFLAASPPRRGCGVAPVKLLPDSSVRVAAAEGLVPVKLLCSSKGAGDGDASSEKEGRREGWREEGWEG
jgi:hypothetical protein